MTNDEVKDDQICKSASKILEFKSLTYRGEETEAQRRGENHPKPQGFLPSQHQGTQDPKRKRKTATDTHRCADTHITCRTHTGHMYAAHNRKIIHGDTHTKIDSASKITLHFLLAALMSEVGSFVQRKEGQIMWSFNVSLSTVGRKAHPETTKDFEKFWDVLALLFCFRYTGPKTRVSCGSRSLRGVKKKSWKIVLVFSLHVIDWSLTSRGFVRDDCWSLPFIPPLCPCD